MRSRKSQCHAKDGYRLISEGCKFYEGLHKSDDCPYRAESAVAQDEKQPKHDIFIDSVRRRNISSGLITSISTLELNRSDSRNDSRPNRR